MPEFGLCAVALIVMSDETASHKYLLRRRPGAGACAGSEDSKRSRQNDWLEFSGLTLESIELMERTALRGNGWVRIAAFSPSRVRELLAGFNGETALYSALFVSVTLPLVIDPPECLQSDTTFARLYGICLSLSLAMYIAAIAFAGSFNSALYTTIRTCDMIQLLARWNVVHLHVDR